jgi:hypothetical protein
MEGECQLKWPRIAGYTSTSLTDFSSIDTNKKASRRGGCTNQIPLTIKPYPMPPSYGIIKYTSTFYWIKLKTKSISIFR